MRNASRIALLSLLVLGLSLAVTAGEEIKVDGTIACAKCTLQKADAKECQDVLVAADGKAEYYLVKNDVLDKAGHQCKGEKAVQVTGTVTEKDGKKWLTATKIDVAKS